MRPVLLAGGSGARLWPLSRRAWPKQFVPLLSGDSLFQGTLQRLSGLPHGIPIVVCNEQYRFLVAEELRAAGVEDVEILLEPAERNTAPALALAALEARRNGEDPVLLVLPADHAIPDHEAFARTVHSGIVPAGAGSLVTFGIVPTAPATGYGYIHAAPGDGVRPVERFVEKPDRASAQGYLDTGGYYWNSGIFMFRASRYLAELERHAPEILRGVERAVADCRRDLGFLRCDADAFREIPRQSIDCAVLEHTDHAVMAPYDGQWSDVGSWASVWRTALANGEGDASSTVTRGDVIARETSSCYLHASHRLLAAVGISDLVVVETADAVLVAPRERAEEIKRLVQSLEVQGRAEQREHRCVHRPWGSYEAIDRGERFQVKRIVVRPGGQLSLQMHHHRAEHWIVVRGTARVVRGDDTFLLSENQSTHIPVGTTHRLENPGHIPLELIEVQSGSYLGEADIVRLSDQYGRCSSTAAIARRTGPM